ncbi:MAG: hypothetical protein V4794_14535 [Pseudomonadota bacterium]
MYGWLRYTPEEGLVVSLPAYGAPADLGIDPKLIPGRKALLQDFIQKELAADPPDVRERISLALGKIIATLNVDAGENLEFQLYMGMAHERLPTEQRLAREELIDGSIATHLAQITDRTDRMQGQISQLRQVAILWPELRIDEMVRSACVKIMSDRVVQLFTSVNLLKDGAQVFPHLWNGLIAFLLQLDKNKVPTQSGVSAWFISTILAQAPAHSSETQSLFVQALQKLGAGFLTKLIDTLFPLTTEMALSLIHDVSVRVMRDKLADPASVDEEIIDTHLAWARGLVDLQNRRMLYATVAAVDSNVPMGDKTASNKAALASARQAASKTSQVMTPRFMDMARKMRPSPTASQPGKEKADLDQPYTWSVTKLLRWIEGPVTRPAQQPMDRKKILAVEKAAASKALPSVPKGKPEPAPPATLLQETDIDGTIQDALSATATFFYGHIQDMLPLARQLDANNPLPQACADLMGPLEGLANKPIAPEDELKARALLTTAEKAVIDLRRSLKTAKATLQVRNRFRVQLVAALKTEQMAWGKRHGGTIACPVRLTDWSFVADNFHDRWLPLVKNVMIGRQNTPLDEDQAAALYVTGSSLSGFAFDVSVHIWQRCPGRTSLPSDQDDAFPAMNTDDWFDTYQTCCVLHVPLAR